MRDPFTRFLTAQAVSRLGDGFFTLGVVWTVYQRTNSIMALGLLYGAYRAAVALAQTAAAPWMVRMNPRTLLSALDLAAGVGVLIPVGLATVGAFRTWELYPVFVWLGALAMPTNAVLRTVVPHLVEPRALRRANARLDGVTEACFITGSAIAGIVIARYGTGTALAVDAVSFVAAAALTASLPVILVADAAPPPSYLASLLLGARMILDSARLRSEAGLVTIQGMVDTAFPVLVVPLALLVLHGTVRTVGYLNGAMSVGVIAGATLLDARAHPAWTQRRFVVPLFCLATAATATLPFLPWALATQVLAGILMVFYQVDWTTRYQDVVPAPALPWVMMFQTSLAGTAEALGAVLTAALARWLGVVTGFAIWGACGALGALWLLHALSRQQGAPHAADG